MLMLLQKKRDRCTVQLIPCPQTTEEEHRMLNLNCLSPMHISTCLFSINTGGNFYLINIKVYQRKLTKNEKQKKFTAFDLTFTINDDASDFEDSHCAESTSSDAM